MAAHPAANLQAKPFIQAIRLDQGDLKNVSPSQVTLTDCLNVVFSRFTTAISLG